MNLAALLARSAARAPAAVALCTADGVCARYSELLAATSRLAGWLREELALQPGDRVALVGRNRPAYVEALFAAWHAGLTVVPVNFRLHASEVAHILADSEAALCVCDSSLRAAIAAHAGALPARILDWEELADRSRRASTVPAQTIAGDELAWLFYTSGTTGRPKGVMLTHDNLRQMILNFFAEVLRPGPGSTLAHFAPLSHGSGMYLLAFIAAGAANLIPEETELGSGGAVQTLNRHQRITMFLAPTMIRRLLDHPEITALERERIELIVYGGGPMLLAGIEEAVERLGPCLAQIYGQGESPMTITRLTRREIEDSARGVDPDILGSVGQPFAGVEVQILAEHGAPLPIGAVGEIAVRGPTVMRGYWRQPDASAAQLRDGWLRTGDLGSFDARGYLTLKDRSRDLIISGGLNIYPREVEEVLALHPQVREVAVVGRGDAEWGERVVAFVVVRAGASIVPAELDSLARSRIAGFKRPREYHFVGQLPRNDYGKVLKRELRGMAEAT
ncbi:MAG: long-chain fatty acid--CoA ligase [Gammaproteobacteria bacterium]|nr:MAG: long-chain fatty acid--CoA ligase [Gammaproteobacteria bacterium]